MKNLLLLSGMDGTGILFCPLLNQSEANHCIAIYDLNKYHHGTHHQSLGHQSDKIAKFAYDDFGDNPFIVVFEFYSSLFVPYLLRRSFNI